MELTMDAKVLKDLLEYGFTLKEDGSLEYASGSTANYKKAKVWQPRLRTSCATDKGVMASYVEYERFSENGYVECDWHVRKAGYVPQEKILDFVKTGTVRMEDAK